MVCMQELASVFRNNYSNSIQQDIGQKTAIPAQRFPATKLLIRPFLTERRIIMPDYRYALIKCYRNENASPLLYFSGRTSSLFPSQDLCSAKLSDVALLIVQSQRHDTTNVHLGSIDVHIQLQLLSHSLD